MERVRLVGLVALPFIWLGAVMAISLLEAPLKFRAPGVTEPVALSIGRLVFQALNWTEVVLLAAFTAALLGGHRWRRIVMLTAGLWGILLVQMLVLRPLLDRRVSTILDGGTPPPSHLHLAYIVLEGIKIVALVVLGLSVATRLVATDR
jgi:hypothetical protein